MFRKSKPLSRKSSTSKTVAEREERKREFSADECRIISQRNRRLQRSHSPLWVNILRATRRSRDRPKRDPFAHGSARLDSSCEFYDVVSICRSLGVVDPFLRQSDGAAKQFLRSSKRPGFAFTLVSRVYGSHDPDAADLRGHHDDLHGSDAALARRVVSTRSGTDRYAFSYRSTRSRVIDSKATSDWC